MWQKQEETDKKSLLNVSLQSYFWSKKTEYYLYISGQVRLESGHGSDQGRLWWRRTCRGFNIWMDHQPKKLDHLYKMTTIVFLQLNGLSFSGYAEVWLNIVQMFLGFLETRIDNPEDWDTLLDAKNIGRDTIFTLLMRRTDSDNFNVLTRWDVPHWLLKSCQFV